MIIEVPQILIKDLIHENCLSEIIYFDELESTNEYAKKNELKDELKDNTLLITANQTKGKGRFSRSWKSSSGKDLTFTLIKNFKIRIDEIHLINFYTSYIIFNSIKEYLPESKTVNLFLKWPNDILLNGKKISGILTDVKDLKTETKKFIIGIGINVNSNEFSDELKIKASSIINETGHESDVNVLLNNIIKGFYKNLELLKSKEELIYLWKKNTNVIGKIIKFRQHDDETGKSVTVHDIDTDGALVVFDSTNNVKKYYSGEIRIVLDCK